MSRRRAHRRSHRQRRQSDDWDEVAAAYRSMRHQRRPSKLYRDTDRGIFGGVCAGLAKYLGIEPWIVRLVFIAFLLLGSLLIPLIVYIVLVYALEPEPDFDATWDEAVTGEGKRTSNASIRSSPKLGLRVVGADIRELELRLRRMETYITSPKYSLDKGFSDMAKH
ncbi:MAG: PspC domain-containing protein [Gammaproteobacteria bacterium]|nr:PspC domain-containing protein [Gammaproteobacteria bacterium]